MAADGDKMAEGDKIESSTATTTATATANIEITTSYKLWEVDDDKIATTEEQIYNDDIDSVIAINTGDGIRILKEDECINFFQRGKFQLKTYYF